ncbi:MAG: glycerol kinase GlpK [Dehalococcoidia bacterium]|nr:glycerol kinase GlpK [Dehalococcoidia bacterium]
MSRLVLALDQGTTSSRALLFNERGHVLATAQHEVAAHFPHPGWVEQDPREIWEAQLRAARQVLTAAGVRVQDLAALGITNQRETALVWDRATGEPIYPAIVWQSRQTAAICDDLGRRGLAEVVRDRTGLVVDPYFSATKVRFILDAVPGAQHRAQRGELAFGTVDTWLLHHLTGGAVHATDATNASRTLMYDIQAREWSDELLAMLDIPRSLLPDVLPSSGAFGETAAEVLGARVPVRGVVGDQQAALFGQGCLEPGQAKNTYGTGCFLLSHTGDQPATSSNGLLTTVAASAAGEHAYALEGSVFVAGAAVQWLRDGLGLIATAEETEAIARSVPDTGGAYLVPAFTGLGAPYWDPSARGALVGLTRGTERAHLVRATLEAIAFQTRDLVECLEADGGRPLEALRVDGGGCNNDFLMQFQADILGIPVHRPAQREVTALGAAGLAGVASGVWASPAEFCDATTSGLQVFQPSMSAEERDTRYAGWQRAVERSRDWTSE